MQSNFCMVMPRFVCSTQSVGNAWAFMIEILCQLEYWVAPGLKVHVVPLFDNHEDVGDDERVLHEDVAPERDDPDLVGQRQAIPP
jgi:hypothetical protein